MATVSQTLAAWIAEAEVPPAQREKSTLRVLDTIGLVAAALNTPQAEAVTDFAAAQGGQAEAGLVGGRRLPAALAGRQSAKGGGLYGMTYKKTSFLPTEL